MKLGSNKSGFTLIELSIVLVIIGLIVGGVLVGQDLIKAAQVRATVAQVEKYNTAVNTFRTKYNGMPGDLSGAANFGFTAASPVSGAVVLGNRLIEASEGGGATEASSTYGGWEVTQFWNHLSASNLVDGNYTGAVEAIPDVTSATAGRYFPTSKLATGFFVPFNTGGYNYYELTGITATTSGAYTLSPNLTPQDAFNIDTKLDDGVPGTGTVLAHVATTALGPTAASVMTYSATTCATASTAYNTTGTYATSPLCKLRFRFN